MKSSLFILHKCLLIIILQTVSFSLFAQNEQPYHIHINGFVYDNYWIKLPESQMKSWSEEIGFDYRGYNRSGQMIRAGNIVQSVGVIFFYYGAFLNGKIYEEDSIEYEKMGNTADICMYSGLATLATGIILNRIGTYQIKRLFRKHNISIDANINNHSGGALHITLGF